MALVYSSISYVDDYNITRISTDLVLRHFTPYPRQGEFPNPLGIRCPEQFQIPKTITNYSFTEITDQRAFDLEDACNNDDLPIVVYWSGGIESTLILAALHKHNIMRDRIIVNLTNSSYYENPVFFEDIIKPNYKYTNKLINNFSDCHLIAGDTGDGLFIKVDIQELDLWKPGSYKKSIHNPDELLAFFAFKTDKEHAKWFYEAVMHNAHSANMPLNTYEDFLWWFCFNITWCGYAFKPLEYALNQNTNDYEMFFKNNFGWYGSDDYQSWAINNTSTGLKYAGTPRSYKMPAKEYIYDVDKNWYYRDYKTKMGISSYYPKGKILQIHDDGKILYKD